LALDWSLVIGHWSFQSDYFTPMFPYIHYDYFLFGPLTIHVWGLMVSLGIIAGTLMARYLAKKYFYSADVILDMVVWILIGALVTARLFHVAFYEPLYYVQNPWDMIKFWQGGASSLGGFTGAGLALWLFAKTRRFGWKEILPYFDFSAVGLWLGWGIGRIGCFLTHQHPGKLTNLFLGINYPEGARFDLGIAESLVGFLLFVIFFLLFKRLVKIRWGLVASLSIASYAFLRFFLDFLRATPADIAGGDVRYLALTPAQWGMSVVLLGLTATLVSGKIRRRFEKNLTE